MERLLPRFLRFFQLYIVCLGIPRLCDSSVKELTNTALESNVFDNQFSLFVEEMISLWTVFSESWALQILRYGHQFRCVVHLADHELLNSTGGSLYQLVSVPRENLAYSLAVLTLELSVICALVSGIYTRRLRRVLRQGSSVARPWTRVRRPSHVH